MTPVFAILIFIIGFTAKDVTAENEGPLNMTEVLDSLLIGYDKRVRPNFAGPGIEVGVSIYVLSISSISDVDMDFTFTMYFRQFWNDPRLAYTHPGLEKIVTGEDFGDNLWVPDTFFVNEKNSVLHKVPTNNQFVRIKPNGDVLKSIRVTVTASCAMSLQYFPMDRQLCYLEIETFGFTMNDIRYKWNSGLSSVQITPDVSLPEFSVRGHRLKTIESSLSSGNYSRLTLEVQFQRSSGHYVSQVYIPAFMFVVLSWVSFWINRDAIATRVGIALFCLLGLIIITTVSNLGLPKVSYMKAIDVYTGTCLFFVFISLLEFSTIVYIQKGSKNLGQGAENDGWKQKCMRKLYGCPTAWFDKVSRILFPVSFIVFVIAYKSIYSGATDDDLKDLIPIGY